jgi:hypothetical protein
MLKKTLAFTCLSLSISANSAFVYEGAEISGFNKLEYNGKYWNITFNEGNCDIANINVLSSLNGD